MMVMMMLLSWAIKHLSPQKKSTKLSTKELICISVLGTIGSCRIQFCNYTRASNNVMSLGSRMKILVILQNFHSYLANFVKAIVLWHSILQLKFHLFGKQEIIITLYLNTTE